MSRLFRFFRPYSDQKDRGNQKGGQTCNAKENREQRNFFFVLFLFIYFSIWLMLIVVFGHSWTERAAATDADDREAELYKQTSDDDKEANPIELCRNQREEKGA